MFIASAPGPIPSLFFIVYICNFVHESRVLLDIALST